jgi:serine phosphatase RsbU (regulator of sigma subunit)
MNIHPVPSSAARALARCNPLLSQLPEAALENLLRAGAPAEFSDGERLVVQGALSDAAYLIVAGEVEVVLESAYDSTALVQLPAGSLIGEVGVLAGTPRTASVMARGPVRALRFAGEDLLAASSESLPFWRSIAGRFGQQIATYNNALGFYTSALSALEQRNFDLALLNDLMHPMPELVNFAQSFRRIAEQVMLRQQHYKDMTSAAAIQRAILPDQFSSPSHIDSIEIHAEMRPAKELGGDLYDYFFIDEDKLAITIGDVSGKGIPASLFMAVTQSVLRLVLRQQGDLGERIRTANDLLVANNREMMFVTLFCGVLDLSSGVLSYCNCGHNAPRLLRADGTVEPLTVCGPPMALQDGVNYTSRELQLRPADCVFLFTDGITEALNIGDEQFGDERLDQTIAASRSLPPRELVEHVIEAATAFAGDAPQADDMTCLSFVYRASHTEANNLRVP